MYSVPLGRDRVVPGRPTDAQIEAVLDEFEKTAWAGLDADRYSWAAVLHREQGGGVHVHVLTARCDLETGKEPEHRAARLAEDLRPVARRSRPVRATGSPSASSPMADDPVGTFPWSTRNAARFWTIATN